MTTHQRNVFLAASGLAFGLSEGALLAARARGLSLLHNEGVGLGLLAWHGALSLLVELLGLGVLAWALRTFPSGAGWPEGWVLGGALSNMLNRIVLGAVPDYLHLAPWPYTFNVADVLIRAGALVWVVMALLGARGGKTRRGREPS